MTLLPTADKDRSPSNYAAHIASEAWAERKARFYHRHPRRCAACAATRELHLHHKTYARFGAERDGDLACLCARCHSIVHQYHAAVGGSLAAATDAVLDLLRRAAADERQRRKARRRAPARRAQRPTVRDQWGRTVDQPSWLVVVTAS